MEKAPKVRVDEYSRVSFLAQLLYDDRPYCWDPPVLVTAMHVRPSAYPYLQYTFDFSDGSQEVHLIDPRPLPRQ